jgi:L,D-transpeptidase YcfS
MITAISFSPTWYPTPKTLSYFKSKGIDLPSAVPAGSKYNYMGSAKISLSHRVNGQEIYRIHGTIHEESIGTSESGGCIRMKNKEVLELANLLQNFTKVAKKSYGNIKVILK